MKMKKVIAVIVLLITCGQSLNFKLTDSKQFCMRFQGGVTSTLQYVISGNQDQNVRCTVTHGTNMVFDKKGQPQFQFKWDYQGSDPVYICFLSTDADQKQVSFDFYRDTDPIRNMIDKKDVTLVQGALSEAYKEMQAISRNQQYQIERDQKHKLNLQDSQTKIKWAGIIKIAFLLASALIQLMIMKGLFTTNNSYQPVESV